MTDKKRFIVTYTDSTLLHYECYAYDAHHARELTERNVYRPHIRVITITPEREDES